MDTHNLIDITADSRAATHLFGPPATFEPGVAQVSKALTATPVHLHVEGLRAWITPALAEVAALLQCPRRRFGSRGLLGCPLVSEQVPFSTVDPNGRLCFPVGYVPRVLELLAARNMPVTITRCQDRIAHLALDAAVLAGAGAPGHAILQATQRQPVGRIILRYRHQVIRFLALICRAYPQAQIAIAVSTSAEAKQFSWLLEKTRQFGRVEIFNGRGMRYPARITVTTYGSLKGLGGPIQPKDILLLVEPAKALNRIEGTSVWASQIFAQRTYALEVGIGRPDPYPDFVIEGMAGRVIHSQVTQPQYDLIRLPPLDDAGSDRSLTNLQRQRLRWHDRRCNARVAAVAVALAVGDARAMRRLGIPTAALIPCGTPRHTVLLVDSVEQGRELQRLLPGWPLLHQPPEGPPAKLPEIPVRIITIVCARATRPRADIVIYTGDGDPRALVRPAPSPTPRMVLAEFGVHCRPRPLAVCGMGTREVAPRSQVEPGAAAGVHGRIRPEAAYGTGTSKAALEPPMSLGGETGVQGRIRHSAVFGMGTDEATPEPFPGSGANSSRITGEHSHACAGRQHPPHPVHTASMVGGAPANTPR